MQQMEWPMDQMFQGCFTIALTNIATALISHQNWLKGEYEDTSNTLELAVKTIFCCFFGVFLGQSIDIMKLQPVSHIATGTIPFRKPFGGWVHNQSPTIEQPITHIITISLFH